MNNKGFISISVVYSFLLVFIAIVFSIIAMYTSRRLSMFEIQKDVKNLIDSKSNFDCVSNGITNLGECIIHKYGGEDAIKNQVTPNFSVATKSGEYGLYSASDDYGDSYYFRGDVPDNYVRFGKDDSGVDMYWRIVRINGDGTIRMIYDGITLKENGVISDDVSIGESLFAEDEFASNYVNYTDSTVKTKIDEWFLSNLKDNYNDYLDDLTLFCNDREEAYRKTCTTPNEEHNCELDSNNEVINCNPIKLKDSFCVDQSSYHLKYASLIRITQTSSNPKLTCTRHLDELYVGYGLTYPSALLTIDEVAFAGGMRNQENTSYYLYRGNSFYVMTAYDNDTYAIRENDTSWGADMWFVREDGAIATYDGYNNDTLYSSVRPVINLVSSMEIKSGKGTVDSPYILKGVN